MEDTAWFPDLVAELYAAAAGETPFSPLAPKIAAAFNSGSCILHVRNGHAGPIEQLTVTPNYTAEIIAAYDAFYYQHDVWANFGMLQPPGLIQASDDLPMSQLEFRETVIYREQARFTDSYYVLGAVVPVGGPDGALGVFGVHRGEREAIFSAEEKRRGQLFLSHLKRALQLRERLARLEIQQHAMSQAMEKLALGIILVSGQGQMLFANRAAEDLLRQGDGLMLSRNRLHAAIPAADAQLRRLLQSAAGASLGQTSEPGGFLRLPRQAERPICLSIYPFMAPHLSNGTRVPACLIFISDPNWQKPPRSDVLARMYRLTSAEARLFEALLAGERLQDYAARFCVSLQTVKTQLSRLFHKTGHSRQTDLVREGLSNPILTLSDRSP